MDSKEFELLVNRKDAIKSLKSFCDGLYIELSNLVSENCPHEDVSVTEEYHSGGYDYVSENLTYTRCNLCGTLLKTTVERGSQYE